MESRASLLNMLFARARPSGLDKSESREALEDFTTEALAGAIRRDFSPFRRALLGVGLLDPKVVSGDPRIVITQRSYSIGAQIDRGPDEVRPDLVLIWPNLRQPFEQWIEVKVDAGLSGANQLMRYERAQRILFESDHVLRPPVILVAPSDLRHDIPLDAARPRHDSGLKRVGWLAWQMVVDAVNTTSPADTLWLELAAFLEEIGMTRERSFPITAREATSLEDAYHLYLKTSDLLREVNKLGMEAHPDVASGWWAEGQAPGAIRRSFRDHGRFTLSLWGRSKIGLTFGLVPEGDGEARYSVWLESDPRNADARARAQAKATDAGLTAHPAAWQVHFEGWPLLSATAHAVNFGTLEEAAGWFVARFAELSDAGLFALQRELQADNPAAPPHEVGDEEA